MRDYWQARYEAGDTPWEKGAAAPGLIDFLDEGRISGSVLVPGCGFGHDVRAIARVATEVVGMDFATAAVEGAAARPPIGSERYVQEDFFALPEAYVGRFDWVWEHTLFCAIDPADRGKYAESVDRALRSGGHFLAVFYLNPRPRERGESEPPHGVSPEELDALFGAHFELMRRWVPARCFEGREGREEMRLYRKP